MPKTIDWERRGYNDYPRHDLYPFRDTYNETDEKDYLTGWHKRYREIAISKFLGEE